MNQLSKEPCKRCGTLICVSHPISLRTVMQLSRLAPDEFVEKIVQLEGIDREVAQEFVDHKMGHNCIKSEPPCPGRGAPLKTWHAGSCLKCSWKRDPKKSLLAYYK